MTAVGGVPATTDCKSTGDPVTNRAASERTVPVGFPRDPASLVGLGAPEALTTGAGAPPTNTTGARSTRNGMIERLGLIFSLPFAGTVWGVEIRGSNL